mgnify:CR=1 FL=1
MTARRSGLTWTRRLARLIVALVLVGIVVMVAGYRLGPERVWLFAAAQYVPYPVFLIPSVLAVVLSLMLGWGWRLASVAGLALVLDGLAKDPDSPHAARAQAKRRRLHSWKP